MRKPYSGTATVQHLNARQVEAFRAVMLTSSTVGAAEMMHITQPAVSRLLHEFQQAVGLTLFERAGNRLKPTPDAQALYAEVERSFVGLDRIAHAATELRARRAGVLRIAAMPALCNGFLPRYVSTFPREHPRLDLSLSGLASSTVVDWVVSEQCDIGFGLSIVDPFTAEQYESAGVVARPFEPAIEFQMAALYPARRELTPVAQEFVLGFRAEVERFRAARKVRG